MSQSMFDMPMRGTNAKFPSSGGASTSKGTSFQFSMPTPGGTPDGSASTSVTAKESSNASIFRPFTFSTPARGNDAGGSRADAPVPMADDDMMSQVEGGEDDDDDVEDDCDEDDDGASQFDFDESPATTSTRSANGGAATTTHSTANNITMNFTPSRPSHAVSNKPPPRQGFNIQFSLAGGGGGAVGGGGGGSVPRGGAANATNARSASNRSSSALTRIDSEMSPSPVPAGDEDVFSHMSDKTGITAHEEDDDQGGGKLSQESDTSHATSHSAGSAYTCETRSVVTAVAPITTPSTSSTRTAISRHNAAAGADSAGDVMVAPPSECDKEVDTAALARLAEEHEQLTGGVRVAIDKFMTIQNTMRSKLMNAEQEFSSISDSGGSLQVNLAQSLVDLLSMKLQLSIRKVSNLKLVSKLQESLADNKKSDEGTAAEKGDGEATAPMQVVG